MSYTQNNPFSRKSSPLNKDDQWIQKATADIKKRGTEGVCTGDKFGSESCPPGSKRYNLAKTFDHLKIKELRPLTVIPFDTHLMINNPEKHIQNYIDAGSDIVTVHAEVTDESSFGEIHDVLKQNQIGVGFAINPETELPEWSYKFLSSLDQLIVMWGLRQKSSH